MKLRVTVAATLAGVAVATSAAAAAGAGTPTGLKADGLRWTAIANSYAWRPGVKTTALGVRADGLRLQAMAERYRSREDGGWSGRRIGLVGLAIAALAVLALGVGVAAARRAARALDPEGATS